MVITQAVNATVADMKNMGGGGLANHRAESADHAVVWQSRFLAVVVKPGIHRRQHPRCRGFHRPGIWRAVIVFNKLGNAGLASLLGVFTATHTIGNAGHRAFEMANADTWLMGRKSVFVFGFAARHGIAAE